jgi:NhaP-type Na+/H+ or K+/H+ antiporter
LFIGTVASPFVLGIFDANTPQQLIFLDHVALGIIAFIAGSERHLQEIRKRLRSILLNTLGIVMVAFALLGIALYLLQSQLAFSAGYSSRQSHCHFPAGQYHPAGTVPPALSL